MNKSILVIDIPEDFDYRRCSMGGDGNIYYEREDEQRTSIIGNIKNLKPIPQKHKTEKENMSSTCIKWYDKGYNSCIDEISGGQK